MLRSLFLKVGAISFASSSLNIGGEPGVFKFKGEGGGIVKVWLSERDKEEQKKMEEEKAEVEAEQERKKQRKMERMKKKREQEEEENAPKPLHPKSVSELLFGLAVCRVRRYKSLVEKKRPIRDGGKSHATSGPVQGHFTLVNTIFLNSAWDAKMH